MKTKQFKQDILNHQESIVVPRLNAATETRTSLTSYGREWKTVKMQLDSQVIRLLKQ